MRTSMLPLLGLTYAIGDKASLCAMGVHRLIANKSGLAVCCDRRCVSCNAAYCSCGTLDNVPAKYKCCLPAIRKYRWRLYAGRLAGGGGAQDRVRAEACKTANDTGCVLHGWRAAAAMGRKREDYGATVLGKTTTCNVLLARARREVDGVRNFAPPSPSPSPSPSPRLCRPRHCTPTVERFLEQLQALPAPREAAIVDVGANSGTFAAYLAELAESVAPGVRVRLILIEPQRRFATQLTALAARWPGSAYVRAVALGTADYARLGPNRTIALHYATNSESASVLHAHADRYLDRVAGVAKEMQVPAVDLSQLLHDQLENESATPRTVSTVTKPELTKPEATKPEASHQVGAAAAAAPVSSISFVKLDIEGGEFSLLPQLLATGGLCAAQFVRVEWHLNSLPASKRLPAVGLRLALRSLLETTCAAVNAPHHEWRQRRVPGSAAAAGMQTMRTPVLDYVVEDEEYRPLNFGKKVQGLLEEAVRHVGEGVTKGELSSRLGISFELTVRKAMRHAASIYTAHDWEGEHVSVYNPTFKEKPGTLLQSRMGGGRVAAAAAASAPASHADS